MKAEELRIGNLLKGLLVYHVVSEIHSEYYVSQYGSTLYRDAKPIKLTGKILEQLGFKKNEALYEFGVFAIKQFIVGQQEQWQIFLGGNHLGQFNDMGLHELQNLFFALTGKELSIENVK